jgi:hypothetical protein
LGLAIVSFHASYASYFHQVEGKPLRQPSQYIQQHHIRKIFFENPLGEGTANFACTND